MLELFDMGVQRAMAERRREALSGSMRSARRAVAPRIRQRLAALLLRAGRALDPEVLNPRRPCPAGDCA